jgi:hypothetical protein
MATSFAYRVTLNEKKGKENFFDSYFSIPSKKEDPIQKRIRDLQVNGCLIIRHDYLQE